MAEIIYKNSINIITKVRRFSQIVMLSVLGQWSFYGIFRCPFLVPFVNCQVCPVITCWGRITYFFWGFWIALPLSVVFFGRAFCGWVCPGGLVNQLIGKLAITKFKIRNEFINIAPLIGFFLSLMIVIIFWFVMHNPRSMVPIRTGEFWNSVWLSFEHAFPLWLVRTFVVLGLIVAGFILSNLWCRFVCPTGGLLELLKRISLLKIYKTHACNECNRCLDMCELKTRPDELNCTNCGDCMKSCPVRAIRFGRKKV